MPVNRATLCVLGEMGDRGLLKPQRLDRVYSLFIHHKMLAESQVAWQVLSYQWSQIPWGVRQFLPALPRGAWLAEEQALLPSRRRWSAMSCTSLGPTLSDKG
jgi:hypothetical protein